MSGSDSCLRSVPHWRSVHRGRHDMMDRRRFMMTLAGDELVGKRFELLKELVPNLVRVAWLTDDVGWPVVPQVRARYDQQAIVAAQTLGIVLHPFVLHQSADLAPAFLGIVKNRDHALAVVSSGLHVVA